MPVNAASSLKALSKAWGIDFATWLATGQSSCHLWLQPDDNDHTVLRYPSGRKCKVSTLLHCLWWLPTIWQNWVHGGKLFAENAVYVGNMRVNLLHNLLSKQWPGRSPRVMWSDCPMTKLSQSQSWWHCQCNFWGRQRTLETLCFIRPWDDYWLSGSLKVCGWTVSKGALWAWTSWMTKSVLHTWPLIVKMRLFIWHSWNGYLVCINWLVTINLSKLDLEYDQPKVSACPGTGLWKHEGGWDDVFVEYVSLESLSHTLEGQEEN